VGGCLRPATLAREEEPVAETRHGNRSAVAGCGGYRTRRLRPRHGAATYC